MLTARCLDMAGNDQVDLHDHRVNVKKVALSFRSEILKNPIS